MTAEQNKILVPLAYFITFCAMEAALYLLPTEGMQIWEPLLINSLLAGLFTLLIWLTARLARTGQTATGVFCTAVFILLFCPGSDDFFNRSEVGLLELSSQCMIPFFMGQYTRIRTKQFHRLYFLMLLMGIFCSYTHNGQTIPMCATFLFISYRHRNGFFRMACWPMVVGVVIGTALSIYQMRQVDGAMATDIDAMTSVTSRALRTLWDTKVFVIAVGMTAWLSSWHDGRKMLLYTASRHYVISLCALFSLITLPLAPLGIHNAVTGVCFFCMFWVLFMSRYLLEKYIGKRI